MTALKIALIILGAILIYQVLIRIIRKFYHLPAPAFIGRFLDSDFRRWLQPPDKIIERSGIKPGMTVMELGCGSGAFTPFVARVAVKNILVAKTWLFAFSLLAGEYIIAITF